MNVEPLSRLETPWHRIPSQYHEMPPFYHLERRNEPYITFTRLSPLESLPAETLVTLFRHIAAGGAGQDIITDLERLLMASQFFRQHYEITCKEACTAATLDDLHENKNVDLERIASWNVVEITLKEDVLKEELEKPLEPESHTQRTKILRQRFLNNQLDHPWRRTQSEIERLCLYTNRKRVEALQHAIRTYRQQLTDGKMIVLSFDTLRQLASIIHVQGFRVEYTDGKLSTHSDRPLEPTELKFKNHCRLLHWVKAGKIDKFKVLREENWGIVWCETRKMTLWRTFWCEDQGRVVSVDETAGTVTMKLDAAPELEVTPKRVVRLRVSAKYHGRSGFGQRK